MFLYGMEIMGDGLKQGSGEALKKFLGKLTQNALLGVLTGTIVTAIIQSSTATIVLTVGLIGAGILNMRQAVLGQHELQLFARIQAVRPAASDAHAQDPAQ